MNDSKVRKLKEKEYIKAFQCSQISIYNVLIPKKNYVRKIISIKGLTYPSIRAAERATKECKRTITQKLNDSTNIEYQELESVSRKSLLYWKQ